MEWIWLGFLLSGVVCLVASICMGFIADGTESLRAGWWARVLGITTAALFLISIWTGVLNLSMG